MRDELKFTKFVGKLRKKFSEMFQDILKTQLILKGVITPEDWDEMKEHIQYDYLYDNHFTELKNIEMLNEKINLITAMEPFMGKYFSTEYVRTQILGQSEVEKRELDDQMADDISSGKVIDPLEVTAMDQKAMDDEKDNAELDKEMKKAQIKTQAEKGTTNPSGSTRTPAKSGNGNK